MNSKMVTIVGACTLLLLGVWLGTRLVDPVPSPTDASALPFRAGPFRVDVAVEPTTPVVGENRLRVVVQTADGDIVNDATVQAVAEMPAMGAMPAMQARAPMQETAAGIYEGSLNLSMQGGWPLTVRIEKQGIGEASLGFDLATGRAGLTLASGAADEVGDSSLAPPGTVTIDARRRQLIGVTTDSAEIRNMRRVIRAVGRVAIDERRQTDVSLKYEAWIGELFADFVGTRVERGEVLFTAYNPALVAAQQEYLQAYRREASPGLLEAAHQRLASWDVDDAFIRRLEAEGEPARYVPVRAPRSGTVISRDVVAGTAQPAGRTLMRIADLTEVWVEAAVYEADLSLVEHGMAVEVTLPYLRDATIRGTVDYVYPTLTGETRTGRVRIALANPDGVLKPDMIADVAIEVDLGERLAVPESAVIYAGDTRVLFEDIGDGRLAPRIVTTGQRADGWVEITGGLARDAVVVVSGNFLVASESRLKSGIKQW
jgi:membrane fusion protein, copper/silver efflux system